MTKQQIKQIVKEELVTYSVGNRDDETEFKVGDLVTGREHEGEATYNIFGIVKEITKSEGKYFYWVLNQKDGKTHLLAARELKLVSSKIKSENKKRLKQFIRKELKTALLKEELIKEDTTLALKTLDRYTKRYEDSIMKLAEYCFAQGYDSLESLQKRVASKFAGIDQRLQNMLNEF